MVTTTDPPATVPARLNGNQMVRVEASDRPLAKPNPPVQQRGIQLSNFEDMWRMAVAVAKSGLAPRGMNTPEALFVALEMGIELGLPPMAAIRSIAVVNGKPSIYGDAALALVRGSGLCEYYTEFESDDAIHALACELAVALEAGEQDEARRLRKEIARASGKLNRGAEQFGYTSISKRVGAVNSVVRRFTLADAKGAKLLGKQGPWAEYRDRMLMWRCRGFNLRDNFGDVLQGMYSAEEASDFPGITPAGRLAATAGSATDRLNARLTNRPVSEGQSFEPDPAALAAAEQEAAAEAPEDAAPLPPATAETAEPEPEPAAEPPAGREYDLSTHSGFMSAVLETAQDLGVPEAKVYADIKAWVLSKGKKGKEDGIKPEDRRAFFEEFKRAAAATAAAAT